MQLNPLYVKSVFSSEKDFLAIKLYERGEETEPHASVGASISKFTQQAGGRLHRGGVKAEATIL